MRARRTASSSAVAHGRVEPLQRLGQRRGGDAQLLGLDAVEAQRRLAHGRLAAVADVLDDRPHLLDRGADVEPGARQDRVRVDVAATAQVDAGQHGALLGQAGSGGPRLPGARCPARP